MTYDPRRILEELLEEKAEIQAAITFFAVKAGVIEGAELTPEDLELAQREVRRFAETEVGVSGAAAILGREGGKKGGRARAEALSPTRRSEIASHAAKARWHGEQQENGG